MPMTPWKKRGSQELPSSRASLEEVDDAEAAEIEAALRAKLGDQYEDDKLISDYLYGGLSAAEMERVEERLSTDRKFHELAAPRILLSAVTFSDSMEQELLDSVEPILENETGEQFKAQLDLKRQGVHIGPAYDGGPYRHPRTSPGKLLDACDFQERFAAALGSGTKFFEVECACLIVADSGDPDRWITEVRSARERGAIDTRFARFLIEKLATSAMVGLTRTHPVLSRLSDQIDNLELDDDLKENEHLGDRERSALLQVLGEEWLARVRELFIDMYMRNGEVELAEHAQRVTWERGWSAIFGQSG